MPENGYPCLFTNISVCPGEGEIIFPASLLRGIIRQNLNTQISELWHSGVFNNYNLRRSWILMCSGLSFTEAERRLKENGPNNPYEYIFPSWWQLLWTAFFHPFNIILIVLSTLSYIASDNPNGWIMLILVVISVCLRFNQVCFLLNLYI